MRLRGAAELVVADKNPDRAALAQSLGADQSLTNLDEIERMPTTRWWMPPGP